MAKIYKGQTAWRLILSLKKSVNNVVTAMDLTDCEVEIRYIKPNSKRGVWNITGSIDLSGGVVYWKPADANDLDMSGTWRLWAHTTFADNTEADSDYYEFTIYEPGT